MFSKSICVRLANVFYYYATANSYCRDLSDVPLLYQTSFVNVHTYTPVHYLKGYTKFPFQINLIEIARY